MAKKTGSISAKIARNVKAESRKVIEVAVQYVKAKHFRVIHADGVIGGILPSGRGMNVAFYSERIPFSQAEVFELGPNGEMIRPTKIRKKPGFHREIEMSASMDYNTAKSLMDWLNKIVPVLEEIEQSRNTNGRSAKNPAAD